MVGVEEAQGGGSYDGHFVHQMGTALVLLLDFAWWERMLLVFPQPLVGFKAVQVAPLEWQL